jgi:hypothetical protein
MHFVCFAIYGVFLVRTAANTHTECVLCFVFIYFRNQLLSDGTKYVSMNQTPIYKTALTRNIGAIRPLERVGSLYIQM